MAPRLVALTLAAAGASGSFLDSRHLRSSRPHAGHSEDFMDAYLSGAKPESSADTSTEDDDPYGAKELLSTSDEQAAGKQDAWDAPQTQKAADPWARQDTAAVRHASEEKSRIDALFRHHGESAGPSSRTASTDVFATNPLDGAKDSWGSIFAGSDDAGAAAVDLASAKADAEQHKDAASDLTWDLKWRAPDRRRSEDALPPPTHKEEADPWAMPTNARMDSPFGHRAKESTAPTSSGSPSWLRGLNEDTGSAALEPTRTVDDMFKREPLAPSATDNMDVEASASPSKEEQSATVPMVSSEGSAALDKAVASSGSAADSDDAVAAQSQTVKSHPGSLGGLFDGGEDRGAKSNKHHGDAAQPQPHVGGGSADAGPGNPSGAVVDVRLDSELQEASRGRHQR